MKHTAREEQVLDLLLEGCDNAEIAKRMGIAPRTVKAYFHRLFRLHGIDDDRFIKRVVLAVKIYQDRRSRENVDLGNIDRPNVPR